MKQRSICVVQGMLYSVTDVGDTVEKGRCGCALVALPAETPKYSLVCYNKAQHTLCVARLAVNNNQSLQLSVTTSGDVNFVDELQARWTLILARTAALHPFLAQLGLAFYAIAGAPQHTRVATDYGPSERDVPLSLQNEAHVFYAAYETVPVPDNFKMRELGAELDTNFTAEGSTTDGPPYVFQPVQSATSLHTESKGFECSVLSMTEGGRRAVVIPTESSVLVVVVLLERIVVLEEHRSEIPSVFAPYDATALVSYQPRPVVEQPEPQPLPHHGAVAPAEDSVFQRPSNLLAVATGGTVFSTGGIPAEHMSMIQKIGAGINTASVLARDVKCAITAVNEELERVAHQPNPSVLVPAMLEDQVKNLIVDCEKSRKNIEDCDTVIRALDTSKRDLQQRVDAASVSSQHLLEETKNQERIAMDMRLERSRVLAKLQEQLSSSTMERDDTQRHLATNKKLLATSEDELRQTKARRDVLQLQIDSGLDKLNAIQNAVCEARSRRQELEVRLAALRQEVSTMEAHGRLKASELRDERSRADQVRAHHVQMMEDERKQRTLEMQQLRVDVIKELERTEAEHRAECARAVDEALRRGIAEGREAGRVTTKEELEVQLKSVRLDADRARARLEESKKELQHVIETSMAVHRRLHEQRQASQESFRRTSLLQTRLQVREEQNQSRTKLAMEKVLHPLKALAHGLVVPATKAQVLAMLTALRVGRTPNLSFNLRNKQSAQRDAIARRLRWIEEETLSVYAKGAAFYYQEYLAPLAVAHEATRTAVRDLWSARDGAAHYDLVHAEMIGRFTISEHNGIFFDRLEASIQQQREAREALLREALSVAETLTQASVEDWYELYDLWAEQLAVLVCVLESERESRAEVEAAENAELQQLPSLFDAAVQWACVEAQRALQSEEEILRAAVLADECATLGGITFTMEQARRQVMREARAAQERQAVATAEVEARRVMTEEEGREGLQLLNAATAALLLATPDPPQWPSAKAALSATMEVVHEGTLREDFLTDATAKPLEWAASFPDRPPGTPPGTPPETPPATPPATPPTTPHHGIPLVNRGPERAPSGTSFAVTLIRSEEPTSVTDLYLDDPPPLSESEDPDTDAAEPTTAAAVSVVGQPATPISSVSFPQTPAPLPQSGAAAHQPPLPRKRPITKVFESSEDDEY